MKGMCAHTMRPLGSGGLTPIGLLALRSMAESISGHCAAGSGILTCNSSESRQCRHIASAISIAISRITVTSRNSILEPPA